MRRVLCCALLAAIPARAHADDPSGGDPGVIDVAPAQLPAPAFVTLDHPDATTHGGIETSYAWTNSTNLPGSTLMRFEAHLEYVDHDNGIGGYAQLPISYFSETATGFQSTSVTGIGDLEVGGLYLREFAKYNVTIVGHGGLSLPTGSTSDAAHFANFAGSVSRIADLYLSLPRSTAVRLGFSPIWRSGIVFARADVGLDIDAGASNNTRYDTALRGNIGVGVILDQVVLTAEMTNAYDYAPSSTTTAPAPSGSSWIDTAAFAARLRLSDVEPYVALVLPIDADSQAIMDYAVTVGIEVR
jgi:hypothetical protein